MSHKRLNWFIIGLLILLIAGLYGRVVSFDFIGFDDDYYVYENEQMKTGLNLETFSWAFSFTDKTYWHPLSWLSLLLDAELFGLRPGFFHLTNVIFHILNSILLYSLLRAMTGEVEKAAFVAIFFAIHPLQVESVAWITERKNVLSTFFAFLTLFSYAYYLKKRGIFRYFLTLLSFLLGLLSKPMLVTLPFLFLLLDLWPLERVKKGFVCKSKVLSLIYEKIPFFILSFFVAVITSYSLSRQDIGIDYDAVPLFLRISNALTSYALYLLKIIYPHKLAIYYPFPTYIPIWKSTISLLFLVFVTGFFVQQFKYRKYLLIGWFWYLGTLIPVIGIKQAGLWPAIADRWIYLPSIGIFIIVVWLISDLLEQFKFKREIVTLSSALIISLLSNITYHQLSYWRNSEQIFSHTINVTKNNWIIHYNLGKILERKKEIKEAIKNYEKALAINPHDKDSANALGALLFNQGEKNAGVKYFDISLKIDPDYYLAYRNKGLFHVYKNQYREGLKNYLKAFSLHPGYKDDSEFLYEIGYVFLKLKEFRNMILFFNKSLEVDPHNEKSRKLLNQVTANIMKNIEKLEKDIELNPHDSHLYFLLADHYLYLDDIDSAIFYYEQCIEIDPTFVTALYSLATIYSELEEYDRAISILKKILLVDPGAFQIFYKLSCLYSLAGKVELSLKYLVKAINEGFNQYDLLRKDKRLSNLHKNPKFEELLRSLNSKPK
jgi:protein O-mannosyl-transferase